ncbi:MAG TPA: acetyltransferase [Candidatus Dormibacteraeota bacterium]|jgi:predicted GNAT superfamily acetyltransferase|nr:acetyltransferase [Candidatus Dormibacteraeota bacterium]
MSEGIVVRKCEALEEFRECVRLQREIWEENDLEVEPATLFIVAANTGGQVIGAFDGARLVGYTLALAGVRHGVPYLHSHMTGVLLKYRDRGVGRLLKLFQREEALGRDIRLIEWTFDPLETRNAHFNLNRLGAICRRYVPNLYGVTTSPLHRGLATDRLVAEWALDSPRVLAAVAQGSVEHTVEGGHITLPTDLERRKAQDPERLADVQVNLQREFTEWFGRGYAAVGLRASAQGTAYVLAPWSDF